MAETDSPRRRTGTRTNKRSRSGAHIPCPLCDKRLRTQKGLGQHLTDVHPLDAADHGQNQAGETL